MKILKKLFYEIVRWVSFLVIWIPGACGNKIRYFLYRSRFARCGKKIVIPQGCQIRTFRNITLGDNVGLGFNSQVYAYGDDNEYIEIGNNVFLNSNVMINADKGGKIVIGNDIMIGPNVVLRSCNHNFSKRDIPIIKQGHKAGFIIIKDDVWIGANVVILADVVIGKGSIVAAGSVVTKNVEEYTIVAGVPAKKIGLRE